MKTLAQLCEEETAATVREHKATMRACAMSFRQWVAPDARLYYTFSERVNIAADELARACAYRRMAASASRRLEGGAS